MNRRLADLYLQQGRLLERIAIQRTQWQQQLAPVQHTARRAAALLVVGQQWVQTVRAHPLVLVALAGGLLLLPPRRVVTWAGRGLLVWRAWRGLRAWLP